MSKIIDERVVQMRFDNSNFEENVKTSINTLDKLKNALKIDKAADGLNNLTNYFKKVDISPLSTGIDEVSKKFTAMDAIAFSVLQRITNSAITAGKQIVNALSVEPVSQGFGLYEQKINAIQTTMTNTGESLSKVNKALDDLNEYSNKTIFKFSDMTASMGKFTAAGLDLDQTVTSIKGIANVAAAAGASTADAGRAFYNIAQAYSVGEMKLIDWKSIENANMATKEFKQQIIEAAKAVGTLDKEGKNAKGELVTWQNLREHLSEGILNTEVMNKVFGEYANEQSEIGKKAYAAAQDVKTFTQLWDILKESVATGWSDSYKIIVGDFDEAKKTLTELSETISGYLDKMSEARNTTLKAWKTLGGRNDLIESFKNSFHALLSVIEPIKQAFGQVFTPLTGVDLAGFTKKLKEFTSTLTISVKTSERIGRIFRGLFSAIDLVKSGIEAAVNALFPFTNGLGDLSSRLLEGLAVAGDYITAFNMASKKVNMFGQLFASVSYMIKGAITVLKEFIEMTKILGTKGLNSINNALKKIGIELPSMSKILSGGFEGILSGIDSSIKSFTDKVVNGLVNTMHLIPKVLDESVVLIKKLLNLDPIISIIKNIGASLENINLAKVLNAIAIGDFTVVMLRVSDAIKDFTSGMKTAGSLLGNVKGVFKSLRDVLASYQNSINAQILMDIAKAIAIMSASIFALSLIPTDKLVYSLGALLSVMGGLYVFISVLQDMQELAGDKSLGSFAKISGLLITVASSMAILSIAATLLTIPIGILAALPWYRVIQGVAGVGTALITMSYALYILADTCGAIKSIGAAAAMDMLALSLGNLVVSVLLLGLVPWQNILRGLGFLAAGIAIIGGVIYALTKIDKGSAVIGFGLTMAMNKILKAARSFSISAIIMSEAAKIFSQAIVNLSSVNIIKMFFTVKIITSALKNLAKISNETSIPTSIAIAVIAAAVNILVPALEKLSTIKATSLLKSIFAVDLVVKALSKANASIGSGIGIFILSTSLNALYNGLQTFSLLKVGEIIRGAAALSFVVSAVSKANKSSISTGIGLYMTTTSLAEFMPVVKQFAELPFMKALKAAINLSMFLKVIASIRGGSGIDDVLSSLADSILIDGLARFIPILKELTKINIFSLIGSLIKFKIVASVFTTSCTGFGLAAPFILLAAGALWILSTAIASSIIALSAVKDELADFGSSIAGAGLVFLEVGVGLAAIAGAIAIFAKADTGKFIKSLLAMGSITAMIHFIVPAVKQLCEINYASAFSGLITLAGAIGTFVGASMLLGKSSTELIAGIAGLFSFVIMLSILTPVLKELASIPFSSIGGGLLILAGTLGIMTGLSMAMAAMGPTVLIGVGSLAALGAVLLFLVPTLQQLQNIDIKNISGGLISLGVALGVLAGLAALFTVFPEVLIGVAILAALGGVLYLLASAFNVFTNALVPAAQAFQLFANGMVVMGSAITTIIQAITEGFNSIVMSIGLLATNLLLLSNVNLLSLGSGLIVLGAGLFAVTIGGAGILLAASSIIALAGAITILSKALSYFVNEVIDGFVNKITSQMQYVSSAGSEMMSNFAKGLTGGISDVVNAAIDAVNGFIHTVSGSIGSVLQTGVSLGKAFIDGLRSQKGIDSHSDSKQTISAAKDAISGWIHTAAKGVKDFWDSGISQGKSYIDGLKDELISGMPEIEDLAGDYSNIMSSLPTIGGGYSRTGGTREYYNNKWKSLSADERKNAKGVGSTYRSNGYYDDQGHFRVNESLIGTRDEMGRYHADAQKAAKYTKEFSGTLNEESDILNQLGIHTKDLTEDTDAYTKAMKEAGAATEGAGKSAGSAKSGFETLRDNIASSIDLFSEFNGKTELTADKLLSNMRSQIEGVTTWSQNMAKLAQMGMDPRLLKKLGDMGPSSFEQVNAFVNMTADQLAEANQLFQKSLVLPDAAANVVANSYQYAGEMFTSGLAAGILGNVSEVTSAGLQASLATLNAVTSPQGWDINSPSKRTTEYGMYFDYGLRDGIKIYADLPVTQSDLMASNVIKAVEKYMSKIKGRELGKYFIDGLVLGINGGDESGKGATNPVAKAMTKIIKQAIKAAYDVSKTASPSKVFAELGGYWDLGLIKGINNGSSKVIDATTSMADGAIDSMRESLAIIGKSIDAESLDAAPTIRPVLDMSNIQNGASYISSMFSRGQAMDIYGNYNLASRNEINEEQRLNTIIDSVSSKYAETIRDSIRNSKFNVTSNVSLRGDAGRFLSAMVEENDKEIRRTGYDRFSHQPV